MLECIPRFGARAPHPSMSGKVSGTDEGGSEGGERGIEEKGILRKD